MTSTKTRTTGPFTITVKLPNGWKKYRDATVSDTATACPSGKQYYRTKQSAKGAASRLGRRFGRAFRTYRCPHCPQWHLTTVKKD